MVYVFIIVIYDYSGLVCFMIICRAMSRVCLDYIWGWHPRDYVREAYKRIGHDEISNF